jgi:hypothetical protein
MRGKPLFALLVASLFVALTFTAVGVGWGEHAEGLSPDSSVSDAAGDVEPLRMLTPFPHPGRDVTVSGNTISVLVPTWLLGDPASFQWAAAVLRPEQDVLKDMAPKGRVQSWTSGSLSEVVDSIDTSREPYEDLTYVRVRSVGTSHIEFLWRCRGDIPFNEGDLAYMMILSTGYTIALHPIDQGWGWFVQRASSLSFDWNSRPYEDVLSASVTQTGVEQLTFEMTTAQDIPDVPPDEDGYPWFTWTLDVDRDGTNSLADVNVVVRWDPESSAWEGALRRWNGQHYEDVEATVVSVLAGATVSAIVDVDDLGLMGSFLWRAQTNITVGVDEDLFSAQADIAPDAGWVEEVGPLPSPTPTVSPTSEPTATATETLPALQQRIYLPVITRGVAP